MNDVNCWEALIDKLKLRMSLFTGYGYQCRFVEDLDNIDADLGASMEWAYQGIRRIQKGARSGKPIMKPR